MVRMSSYEDDPIIEIFDNDNNDDIQVINRDNTQYDQNLMNSNVNASQNYYNDLYDNSQQEHAQQNEHHQPQEQLSSLSSMLQPATHSNHQEPSGLTPILTSNDYNQLTTVNQPKFMASLPPLAPLSESVIPNSLNISPALSLPKTNDSQDKKPSTVATTTKKRKEIPGSKTRPAFVMKIWSMVNDPTNYDYIRWNDNGKTFQVFHREEFMKVILPKYFKHNNFASFVRQLNMYGWHKVQDISNGTLNKDEKSNDEIWQFENPYFIKGRDDLLDKIVRNKTISQDSDHIETGNLNFQSVLNELDQIKVNQFAINEDLRRVRNDNKTLWQENFITRERHQQQAQTLEKILKFLAAVYGNSAGKLLEVDNGSFGGLDDFNSNNQMTTYNYQQPPQAQNQAPHQPMQAPSTTSEPSQPPSPFNRPRLMLMDQAYQKSSSNNTSPEQTTQKNSNGGSIEEIIRSYENTPNDSPNNNVNKIYQQLMNNEPGISSPRHYFPELNNPNSPYFGVPNTPGQQYIKAGIPLDSSNNTSEVMDGLEQNIYKQGESIQQVQDWIQKLSAQQQQQQQQQQQLQHLQNLHQNHKQTPGDYEKPDIDEFDVNEFLDNSHSSNSHTGNMNSDLNDPSSKKRSIDEVNDNNNKRKKK